MAGRSPSRESVLRNGQTYDAWHFAEATVVGNTIWVSGQRGYDSNDEIPEDPDEQARIALRNIESVLQRAGAALDDIVLMTSYHVDIDDLAGFRKVKDEFIRPPYPSWTVVGVAALADPAMRVEVAAVAVRGSGVGARARRSGAVNNVSGEHGELLRETQDA